MEETQVASSATSAVLTDIPQKIEIHEHAHIDEITGLETPEQLLTPENSRSETSSNNENASSNDEKEKPALQRISARVTRASLQAAQLETPETESNDASSATNGDTPVNAVSGGKRASSRLRHSIAVMEWSEASETSDSQSHANTDKHPLTPDTSVSETSQEPVSEEVDTTLQPRTLRKRVDKIKEDTVEKGEETVESKGNDEEQTLRRSCRRGVVERVASRLAEQANTVLGKRTRSAKAKEPDRRSSLRPRSIAPLKEEFAQSTNNDPATKKQRVSDNNLPLSTKSHEEEEEEEGGEGEESTQEEETESAPVLRRSKRWLAHGLYSGQEPEGIRPTQTKKNKTTFRRRQRDAPRNFLPMPMFAGDRLLQNGRDFQLPFDIFSPLPPGQPKPNEWRKTNKSTALNVV